MLYVNTYDCALLTTNGILTLNIFLQRYVYLKSVSIHNYRESRDSREIGVTGNGFPGNEVTGHTQTLCFTHCKA